MKVKFMHAANQLMDFN